MIDQKTIDRVAVGLAGLAIEKRPVFSIPIAYDLLLDLLGIPEPLPDWADRALANHHGTPEELVARLRELAGQSSNPPTTGETTHPTSICRQCEQRIHWTGKYWEHIDNSPRHPGQPRGETE